MTTHSSHLEDKASGDLGLFDRIAEWSSDEVSKAPFFVGCLLLIVIWLPSYPIWQNGDSWQLPINTITTVITFILVALLQNSQKRFENTLHYKLNVIADALADMMEHSADQRKTGNDKLRQDIKDLRAAMGIEQRMSA